MPYITKYNASSMLAKIEVLDITTEGLYKTKLFPLSKPEQQWLATVRKILIDDDISIQYAFKKITRTDNKKLVYEGCAPSYHENKDCEKLNNDYENYELPLEIIRRGDLAIKNFREFVKENIAILETSPDIFNMRVKTNFSLKNFTEMPKLFAENSGVAQENTNIETLEKTIDKLLIKAENFKLDNSDNAEIIQKHGDCILKKEHHNSENYQILLQWHEIKSDIKGNLKYYLMILHNPSLNFRSSLLEQLNFRPCSTCCKRRNYDSWEREIN